MNQTSQIFKRSSLLKRNPNLSRDEFSWHYEQHYGPFAENLVGFRQFATQYVQNHVEALPNGAEPSNMARTSRRRETALRVTRRRGPRRGPLLTVLLPIASCAPG
ncbi:EthD domain-containing protein [Paraburkholderia sediminicola]|uniref:EthD domain-containing protein n=1 Tax=Paraburkholderia sediminicola TaxID=458836 RepID=UPI0038BC27EC